MEKQIETGNGCEEKGMLYKDMVQKMLLKEKMLSGSSISKQRWKNSETVGLSNSSHLFKKLILKAKAISLKISVF